MSARAEGLLLHLSHEQATIDSVIASYTSQVMTDVEWSLAGPFVRAMVRLTNPPTVGAAQVALTRICRFLVTCSSWNRTVAPEQALVFTDVQIAHVNAVLELRDVSYGTRKMITVVARKLRTAPFVQPKRPVTASAIPIALVNRPVLSADASALTVRSWLVPLLSEMVDYAALDRELRDRAGRTGLSEGFLDSALPHLPELAPEKYWEKFVGAVIPMAPTAKQPAAAKPKKTSAAAARRAAKAAKAAPSLPTPVTVSDDIAHAIHAYTPHLPDADWQRIRDLTIEFAMAAQPASPRSARRLMTFASRYILWAETHSGHRTLTLADVADLDLCATYVRAGLQHLSLGGVETQRSVLETAITIIHKGRHPKAVYRKGSPPYDAYDEQALILLARHQPTVLNRARLSSVIALGAGAGLNSAEMRGVTPAHIHHRHRDGIDYFEITVVAGSAPRTAILRDTYGALLVDALRWHREAGFGDGDTLVGGPTNRNVVGRVSEHAVRADGRKVAVEAPRLRATWLLAVMNARVPLTAILAAAGLKSARPIADLVPYLPTPDPAEHAALLAGAS